MIKAALALLFAITTSAISATSMASCPSSLVIDDFSSGQYGATLRPDGRVVTAFRRGTMTGGSRYTIFLSNVIPGVTHGAEFNQRATLDITPGDASVMVVATGIAVAHRLETHYGFGLQRGRVVPTPLNLDLSCFSKFRVHFDYNDLTMNVTMTVTAGNNPGNTASLAKHVNASTVPEIPVIVDFPFSEFTQTGPRPDLTDVDLMGMISQTGSAIGANDYAVTLIEAVP